MSRRGYRKLEEETINEKRLQLEDDSLSRDHNPSPPSRHEKWKKAQERPCREFTSEDKRVVGEKIVSILFCQEY